MQELELKIEGGLCARRGRNRGILRYINQKLVFHGVASNPGSLSGGRGKRAWYTLSAHAPKFPEILGIRIFVRLSIRKREP